MSWSIRSEVRYFYLMANKLQEWKRNFLLPVNLTCWPSRWQHCWLINSTKIYGTFWQSRVYGLDFKNRVRLICVRWRLKCSDICRQLPNCGPASNMKVFSAILVWLRGRTKSDLQREDISREYYDPFACDHRGRTKTDLYGTRRPSRK